MRETKVSVCAVHDAFGEEQRPKTLQAVVLCHNQQGSNNWFGALFFDVWGADTTPLKTLSVFAWTVIFIIALFFVDKNERK